MTDNNPPIAVKDFMICPDCGFQLTATGDDEMECIRCDRDYFRRRLAQAEAENEKLKAEVELWSGEASDNLRNGIDLIKQERAKNESLVTALNTAETALGQWKCDVCRGTGKAWNSMDEPIRCDCGDGLDRQASTALAAIRSTTGGE